MHICAAATAFLVQLEPPPPITWQRLAALSTTVLITLRVSSSVSVGDSPVVPHGRMPAVLPRADRFDFRNLVRQHSKCVL